MHLIGQCGIVRQFGVSGLAVILSAFSLLSSDAFLLPLIDGKLLDFVSLFYQRCKPSRTQTSASPCLALWTSILRSNVAALSAGLASDPYANSCKLVLKDLTRAGQCSVYAIS